MAVLSDLDRFTLWAEYMQDAGRLRDPLPLAKADLRAAVDALDDFLSANAAAINNAIPLPARAALTVPQKASLLMFVIQRRYISGA